MSVPAELQYTQEHEWVAIDGGTATIGITDYATQALGDVVYVSLPQVGAAVTAGEPCGEVESTKSVSDLYSPVNGEVTEVNEELDDDPGLINAEPYGLGWMFRVRVSGGAPDGGDLLSPADDLRPRARGTGVVRLRGYRRSLRQATKQVTLTTARATAPPTRGSIWLN